MCLKGKFLRRSYICRLLGLGIFANLSDSSSFRIFESSSANFYPGVFFRRVFLGLFWAQFAPLCPHTLPFYFFRTNPSPTPMQIRARAKNGLSAVLPPTPLLGIGRPVDWRKITRRGEDWRVFFCYFKEQPLSFFHSIPSLDLTDFHSGAPFTGLPPHLGLLVTFSSPPPKRVFRRCFLSMKSSGISEGQKASVKLPLKLFPHPLLLGGLKKSTFPPFQVSATSVYSIFFFLRHD